MTDRSLTELHRMSVVRLNETDRLDVRAFGHLLEAIRIVAQSDDDHTRAFAQEASDTLRIYVEFTRSNDADLVALAEAFDAET